MKKVIITLLSVIFIISMITNVYAATGSVNFGASSDTVIKGKTFTVTIAGTADSNITGMQAGLSYETSKLSIESKSVGQGFFDASSSNEIAIGSTSAENLSQAGTLYTITFKVLDTASEGETKISLTNAVLATAAGESEAANKEVTVTIKADDTTAGGNQGNNGDQGDNGDQGGNGDQNNNGGQTGTGDQGGTGNQENNGNQSGTENPSNGSGSDNGNTGNGSGSNDAGNNTQQKQNGTIGNDKKTNTKTTNTNTKTTNTKTTNNTTKKLPQTGVESTTLFAIIALAVVGITSFISYKKYKNI